MRVDSVPCYLDGEMKLNMKHWAKDKGWLYRLSYATLAGCYIANLVDSSIAFASSVELRNMDFELWMLHTGLRVYA